MKPFIYDAEKLSAIASEEACREGLKYFKENRVMECYLQNNALFALVEGTTHPDFPYNLELHHDNKGLLAAACDCNNRVGPVCKHAVAALLCYTNDIADQDINLTTAMDAAIKERIKSGQTEVRVKHVSGHPWFGLWQAHSVDASGHPQRHYQVHIRSMQERINFCTCPDRANNQLGTCKHIEAVLHHLNKDKSLDKTDLSPPIPFVYLTWADQDVIRLQRTGSLSKDLADILNTYFNAQGYFKGQLPEAFFEFQNAVYGRNDIVIGLDAKQGVERLAIKQQHQLKAEQLKQRILKLDGRLPGLKATLYPYQIEGVAFLAANGRALMADDMGLGKTLQAIAAANWLIEENGVRRILIVCPASLKHQWAREIEKFTHQPVQVVQGNAEDRLAQYRQDKTFFVLNYELVLRDKTVINEKLAPDLLILDEAQRIKNWRTKIATEVKRLVSQYVFVLTGTPLENRLEDLYSLMQVVDQHLLGPLWRYLNDYQITDENGKVQGYRNLSELRQKIQPLMLRRNRSIVSDQLPDRTTTQLDVVLSPRQQDLHDGALATAGQLAQISKKRPLTPMEQNRMMAALQTARMACDAAGLVDKETEGSPKLNELKTLVQELCIEGGQKMVVFSQWRGMTLMIEAMLTHMKVGYVHLNGQIPTAKRGDLMDRFQHDAATSVFISTDAGGSGLNLQAASVLVNMDIPWNPAVLEQRNARIHRLGQNRKVQIILMVAQDSYEERVLHLVGNKQDLFDNVIDPEASEDVVGISKKSITAVIEELNGPETAPAPTAKDEEKESAITLSAPIRENEEDTKEHQQEAEEDSHLRQGIIALQSHFGGRLEQILVKNKGLLLILENVSEADEDFADSISLPVPVALIDTRTLRQLNRLGDDSPLADTHVYNDESSIAPPKPQWLQQAQEKLSAATMLLEQGEQDTTGQANESAIMELLGAAIGDFLTHKAELSQPMPPDQTPVWIYSEALPKQIINQQDATAIMRILGLRSASNIPATLLREAFNDAQTLINP